MDSKLTSRPGGGQLQAWQSPNGTFHHLFLKLDLDCEPDPYPGVVIVSDESHSRVFVIEVRDLRKELPQLLKQVAGEAVVYWDLETDAKKRQEILSGLTQRPLFVG